VHGVLVNGSIESVPVSIPVLNNAITPWWEAPVAPWELELNNLSDSTNLRNKTLAQFKEVQISPIILIKSADYAALVQNFIVYPITARGDQGYTSSIQKTTYSIYLLLFVFSVFFILSKRFTVSSDAKLLVLFVALLLCSVALAWAEFSVFRYFVFIAFFTICFLSLGVEAVKRFNSRLVMVMILALIVLTTVMLTVEIRRDLNYAHTVGHRAIPGNIGGVNETMAAAMYLDTVVPANESIFSNIQELGYYADRKLVWDDRLFFIDNRSALLDIMQNYNFNYVVLPYYSSSVTEAQWKYYLGVPKESAFDLLLQDKKYFTVREKYNAFVIYERVHE
jgi:hypothetical protein